MEQLNKSNNRLLKNSKSKNINSNISYNYNYLGDEVEIGNEGRLKNDGHV